MTYNSKAIQDYLLSLLWYIPSSSPFDKRFSDQFPKDRGTSMMIDKRGIRCHLLYQEYISYYILLDLLIEILITKRGKEVLIWDKIENDRERRYL
jgi:hypothetical protein